MIEYCNEYRGVAMVMPCLNEAQSIEECVVSLIRGTMHYPLIILDGGSRDETCAIIRRMMLAEPRLHLLANPKKTQACAVNMVANSLPAEFRWIVRADAHALYPANFVSALLSVADEVRCSSVVVSMRAIGRTWFERAAACAQNSVLGNGGSKHRKSSKKGKFVDHGHHALFDANVFRSVGGYDETFTHNEDFELDFRIRQSGGAVWLASTTHVDYFPRSNLFALAKQYVNHGRGRAKTIAKHRIMPKPRQSLPVAMLACYLLAAFAGPFFPWVFLLPAMHLALCCLWGVVLSFRERDPCALASGPLAIVMHLSWACGLCYGLVKNVSLLRAQRVTSSPPAPAERLA